MVTLSEKARAFSMDVLLGEPEVKSGKFVDKPPASESSCMTAELSCKELWKKFYQVGTEMIITKAGRRMFPALKVRFFDLDLTTNYIVFMDIVPVDTNRYKYVYPNSQWVVAGVADAPLSPMFFIHPDSPAPGRLWMAHEVSFEKVKLTNNHSPVVRGQIPLHSMHKYIGRVHVMATQDSSTPPQQQIKLENTTSFVFPETSFITVTAYQNQKITRLKIESNPFAKGFRESSRNSMTLVYDRCNGGNDYKKDSHKKGTKKITLHHESCPSTGSEHLLRRIKLVIPPTHLQKFTNYDVDRLNYTWRNEHYLICGECNHKNHSY